MLGVNPADLRAYRALERHYAARERWRDLEELLGTRGSFASAAEVPDITHRRAELRATRLDDVDGALQPVESIVRTVPQHEGARRLLEKLLTVPDQRLRVAGILEPPLRVEQPRGRVWSRTLERRGQTLDHRASAAVLAARPPAPAPGRERPRRACSLSLAGRRCAQQSPRLAPCSGSRLPPRAHGDQTRPRAARL